MEANHQQATEVKVDNNNQVKNIKILYLQKIMKINVEKNVLRMKNVSVLFMKSQLIQSTNNQDVIYLMVLHLQKQMKNAVLKNKSEKLQHNKAHLKLFLQNNQLDKKIISIDPAKIYVISHFKYPTQLYVVMNVLKMLVVSATLSKDPNTMKKVLPTVSWKMVFQLKLKVIVAFLKLFVKIQLLPVPFNNNNNNKEEEQETQQILIKIQVQPLLQAPAIIYQLFCPDNTNPVINVKELLPENMNWKKIIQRNVRLIATRMKIVGPSHLLRPAQLPMARPCARLLISRFHHQLQMLPAFPTLNNLPESNIIQIEQVKITAIS